MRKTCDFVLPANILTVLRTPHLLGLHDTLSCVLIKHRLSLFIMHSLLLCYMGTYHGLLNSIKPTDNLTHGSPQASCGNQCLGRLCCVTSLCSNWTTARMISDIRLHGGWGNRMHGITTLLMLAIMTRCVFLIQLTKPVDINLQFSHNVIQWNYIPSARLFKHSFDFCNPKNFNYEYKSFEAALSNQIKMYDLIEVHCTSLLWFLLSPGSDE